MLLENLRGTDVVDDARIYLKFAVGGLKFCFAALFLLHTRRVALLASVR